MCGIAGIYCGMSVSDGASLRNTALMMSEAIAHRGPDDHDVWTDADRGISLGHRRLSIIDLSDAGRQPMISANGRYVLVYNGEIFNFQELRERLEKIDPDYVWRGTSDSEVLVQLIQVHGVAEATRNLIGMYAFAAWDREDRALTLARDIAGEKPMYYGFIGSDVVFASEPKAFHCHPRWENKIDPEALAGFFRYGYVNGGHSIYRGIHRLKPGCLVVISDADIRARRLLSETRYWNPPKVDSRRTGSLQRRSNESLLDDLDAALSEAVRCRMISDVPLGAFLSGGTDSSLIVAMMQEQCSGPIETFTVGFEESGFNEAEHAKNVARHLGTKHHELYVKTDDLLAEVSNLAQIYDEPFGDSSQLPTLLLCRLTRQQVTVALSGDGGDELFGGYTRYERTLNMYKKLRLFPEPLRTTLARTLRKQSVERGLEGLEKLFLFFGAIADISERANRLSYMLSSDSLAALYEIQRRKWVDTTRILKDVIPSSHIPRFDQLAKSDDDKIRVMMRMDFRSYLPDDILVKVDRAAMSVSLETRIPLLDRRVVEVADGLVPHSADHKNLQKWALKSLLYRRVPRSLVDRPKSGFGVPIGPWLKGPLQEWITDLLAPDAIAADGIFHVDRVQRILADHLSGRRNYAQRLWSLVVFRAWQQKWKAHL